MKIIVDTNVIARLIIDSDIEQAKIAADLIDRAEEVIIPTCHVPFDCSDSLGVFG